MSGLCLNPAGHWKWLDSSVVDYTNWGESTDFKDYDQECAFISTETKQWGKQHCTHSYAKYICKTAKGNKRQRRVLVLHIKRCSI